MVIVYFLFFLVYVILNDWFDYINVVISSMFIIEFMIVKYWGNKLYVFSDRNRKLGRIITMLGICLMFRAFHIIIQEIVHLASPESICLLEDYVLDVNVYSHSSNQAVFALYFLSYYLIAELAPCIIL